MSTSKELVIQDACIIFDLIDLGLIKLFFDLEITVFTTPQVLIEVEDGEQLLIVTEFINNGKLKIDSKGSVEAVYQIVEQNSGLSFADSSVLELAIRISGSILSSDLKLRNAGKRSSLTVRGVLWVIDELYLGEYISAVEAIDKLTLYQNINDRAPRGEIKSMINRLTCG